ncbi:MAG TPA: Ig-like domain-containing protein [Vicinamibacterales bacterium]|nr:Ig-like domain-containing protein [Vicinamibacterales bacterium]
MRRSVSASSLAIAAILVFAAADAQLPARVATTAQALVANPVFYQGKHVAVRHSTAETAGVTELAGTVKPVAVYWRQQPSGGADVEIRGEFWDLGRLQRDDGRLAGVDLGPLLQSTTRGEWPSRDRVFVILGATTVDSPLPQEPSVRALAIAPEHYDGKSVTVVGRFRGTNLFGDLPVPVSKSQWDFVIQSADAAIWVTGMRPRGKGFNLDPGARLDTGHWLQVTGVLRNGDPLPWIEATAVAEASAPAEAVVEVPAPVIREPAPVVIFSAPVEADTDVARTAPVRIQFSRDMDPKSFQNQIRVSYLGGQGTAAPPSFTVHYDDASRGVEIKFSTPLDRFRQVKIELMSGIVSAGDQQPLAPWSLTFTTGE